MLDVVAAGVSGAERKEGGEVCPGRGLAVRVGVSVEYKGNSSGHVKHNKSKINESSVQCCVWKGTPGRGLGVSGV